jgi:hypothetical protein
VCRWLATDELLPLSHTLATAWLWNELGYLWLLVDGIGLVSVLLHVTVQP